MITSRDQIIAKLQSIRPELEANGVAHLYLFGSAARDELHADSDVDMLVDPGENHFSMFSAIRVSAYCEPFLGCKIDIVDRRGLKNAPVLADRIQQEMVQVF